MANYSLNTPYLLLGGLLLIAVALVFLQYQPMIRRINELRAEVGTLQNSVADRQTFLETIDRKRTELAAYQEHERGLDVILPQLPQLEDVVRIVQAAAQETGGRVARFVNQSEGLGQAVNAQRARGEVVNLPEAVAPLGASVQLTGSYSQLRAFLEELATSARLIDVMDMTINAAGDVPDQLTLEASLRFYHLAQP